MARANIAVRFCIQFSESTTQQTDPENTIESVRNI